MTEEPLLKRAVELALTYEAAEKSTKDMQVRQSGQDSLVGKVSGSLSIIRIIVQVSVDRKIMK